MMSSVPLTAVLTCHPETYSQAVHRIEARICWTEGGVLALTYTLQGDITRVWIPPPRPPRLLRCCPVAKRPAAWTRRP